ncbi:MAG: hypothetical protein JSR80_03610 [Verrucomicrobia bacterium]|nr:hypothetical protein [Verrucomicrobiota bacterium]
MNKSFISFEKEIRRLLPPIVKDTVLHGRWINTLSYLENCGARKIASCEHPTLVREEMLKHAAEEFRHAFYLKKQLPRIDQHYEDYRLSSLLGGWSACHYLNTLDLHTSRYLKILGMGLSEIKQLAYLLVTYAIELRAGELYPIYQSILREQRSKIQVQSVLLEEKEHLKEMEDELRRVTSAPIYVEKICAFEAHLFKRWLHSLFRI